MSSRCHPLLGVYSPTFEVSKLTARSASAVNFRGGRASGGSGGVQARRSTSMRRVVITTPPSLRPPVRRPILSSTEVHMCSWILLGEAQMRVQRVRQAVSASCPRLDLEPQGAVVRGSSELDLPGLQMPGERCQSKRRGGGGDDAHGAVPGAGHPHEVLVPHGEAPVAVDLLECREPRRARRGRDLL